MGNSLLIYVNSRLLDSKMAFLQTCCLLGYASLPIAVAAFACMLGKFGFGLKLGLMAGGVAWSVLASFRMMQAQLPEGKVFIGLYPLIIYFLGLSWFLIFV
jgi:hypothetical protein